MRCKTLLGYVSVMYIIIVYMHMIIVYILYMYIIMVYLIYVYDSNNVISLKLNETRHLPFHDNIWQCYQKVLSIIYIFY